MIGGIIKRGLAALAEMFLSAFTGEAKLSRTQPTQRAPKDCTLRGYLAAPVHRKHALEVTTDENQAFRPRTWRGPGTGELICVWRKVWPDNGRKSKRYAQA